jgi:hypothetical protein
LYNKPKVAKRKSGSKRAEETFSPARAGGKEKTLWKIYIFLFKGDML